MKIADGQIELSLPGRDHIHDLLEVKDLTTIPRHALSDTTVLEHFKCFKCTACEHHFYMRKVDLESYFTEGTTNHRELEERGSLFFQDREGMWHMIFTIIS